MNHIIFLLIIPILLVLSAFFSGAETAITAASKAKLHHLAKKGDTKAVLAQKLHMKIGNVISTVLIANQMTNHIITTIATWLVIDTLGESSVPLAAGVLGLIMIVYVEIAPKILAINDASRYTLNASPILKVVVTFMKPLTTFLESCAHKSLKLFGVNIGEKRKKSDDELRGAIDLHAEGGEEEAQERLMMKSILDLSELDVSQIMIHRKNLFTLDSEISPEKIVSEIIKCPYSRIPIWEDNPENIIGILHSKTLLKAAYENDAKSLDIMSLANTPWFIPESTCVLDQLQAFRDRREHFALVVDEYGALMGSITLEDILEEVVGEIVDEYDVATTGVSIHADQSILVEGSVLIRDLNRQFDWNLPEDEATTIAGLVMHETRKIPEVGQVFILYDLKIEILRRQKNQVSLLKIVKKEF